MNIKESLEEFYEKLLGVEHPWVVESIRRDSKKREVTVIAGYSKEEFFECPVCGKRGKLHDHRLKTSRAWRIKEAATMLWDYTYSHRITGSA